MNENVEGGVGLLFDATRCAGCGACTLACRHAQRARLGPDATPGDPGDRAFTELRKVGERTVRKLCWHCEHPACASVCPVKAIEKLPWGPVVYHEDRCMGCRYCMQACPFGVPRYDWDSRAPRIWKCQLCNDRLDAGGRPACAEACPTGATLFGSRASLIEEARSRIRAAPERYHDRIHGLDELGGSSVLMISDVPLETIGAYPRGAGTEPLPQLTWKVLRKLPAVVCVGGAILGGVCWITRRRMEIAAGAEASGSDGQPEEPR